MVRAIVVDRAAERRLAVREVDDPVPAANEAVVRVKAISLNRGEVKGAMSAPAGTRPGWDLAGVVEQPAADGSGPAAGTRVVGLVSSGAWAELVSVPTTMLAALPDTVSFAQAATLPVAGLTALHAVEKATGLLGRTVLVTGASGGVGLFACQLAHLAGARVVGVVHQARSEAAVRDSADEVVVSPDGSAARAFAPYRLIVETVGGAVFSNVVPLLGPDGVCVVLGATAGNDTHFGIFPFAGLGRASIYGLVLFNEFTRETAADGLDRLARLVAEGKLRPRIEVEAPWTEIDAIAAQFLERRFPGKAVLHVS